MMRKNHDPSLEDPAAWVRKMRTGWAMSLLGLVAFSIIMVMLGHNRSAVPDPFGPFGWLIAWAALIALTPLGYFLRSQTYKRHWREHAVTPAGYLAGNLLLLAAIEAAFFFNLIRVVLAQRLWPTALPLALALLVFIVNYPTGKAMQPHPPVFENPSDR